MGNVMKIIAVSIIVSGLSACAGSTGNGGAKISCDSVEFDARKNNHFLRARRIGQPSRNGRGGSCDDHS